MATLVLTITTPDSVADVQDRLDYTAGVSYQIKNATLAARYLDGIANGSYNVTTLTEVVS